MQVLRSLLRRFRHRRASRVLFLILAVTSLSTAWLLTSSAEAKEKPGASTASPATASQAVQVMNFSYSPANFTAPAGEALTVTVTNSGPAPHTFTITGLTDSGQIAAGTTKTVTFTPTQAGSLTFFCTIHGQNVMSGRITVQGSTAPAQAPTTTTAPPPAPRPNTAPLPVAPQVPANTMRPPGTGDGGLLVYSLPRPEE